MPCHAPVRSIKEIGQSTKEESTEFMCLTQLTKYGQNAWSFLLHKGTKTHQLSLSPCNLATLIPTGSCRRPARICVSLPQSHHNYCNTIVVMQIDFSPLACGDRVCIHGYPN